MVVKSLKPLLEPFSKTKLFFCIRIDLLYWYHFSVFVPISSIATFCISSDPVYRYRFLALWYIDIYNESTVLIYLACYHLLVTPDSCMLSPDTCLISLITCHLIHDYLTVIITFTGILSWYSIQYTMTYISSTNILLNLSCSCHSRKLIIT